MSPKEISEVWTRERRELEVKDFFALAPAEPFAFLYGDGPGTDWLILGWEPLLITNDPAFQSLAIERRGDAPAIKPDFIGVIAYEYGVHSEPLRPQPAPDLVFFPRFRFCLYRHLLAYHRPSQSLFRALRESSDLLVDQKARHCLQDAAFSAHKTWDSDTAKSYATKVECIRDEIGRGNVYQVNLTRQEHWTFAGDLRRLAMRLYDANPAPYSALIAGTDFAVVSSSPECFLRLRDRFLLSCPIKGTAPRSNHLITDRQLAEELLASEKNRAELAMIVDLVRNDLTRVCRVPSVSVVEFARLESYANVHHLVATIAGEIPTHTPLEMVLAALFPAGSITGCPKLAAMQIIHDLEGIPRGAYTGAVGWFAQDLSQLELSVSIRTIFADQNTLAFGVGGGIVWDSDPVAEYEETVHKGRSIVQCLNS